MTGGLTVLAHAAPSAGDLSGNPLYRVLADHAPGLYAAALVPIVFALLRWRARAGDRRAASLVAGYRRLPANERFLTWLLATTAAIHVGLVVGARPVLALLFLVDALALAAAARRLVLGRRWRRLATLVLLTSIAAYLIAVVATEPPDQVGLATKLIELAALGLVLQPRRPTRLRRLASSTGLLSLVLTTGLAAWVGAFAAAERGGGAHGAVPMPGTLVTLAEEREPTPAEQRAADRFFKRASSVLAAYRDPTAAATDGYAVGGIAGTDFHAGNAAYASDGRVFDPARPESLVYAQTGRGPVLLGAVYEMPEIGQPGPRIGGPITDWHGHENICFAFAPPALSGLVSPFGVCPFGSLAIPVTPEMIHLWVVPGAPTRFGDLDDEWRAAYLTSRAG